MSEKAGGSSHPKKENLARDDEEAAAAAAASADDGRRRAICSRCDRPTPSACICEALPLDRVRLTRCRCLVLQHPHESKRKNRSLPIVQLCLDPESLVVSVGRRFGLPVHCPKNAISQLLCVGDDERHQEDDASAGTSAATAGPIWLVSPGPDAIPLHEALKLWYEKQHQLQEDDDNDRGGGGGGVVVVVNLIFLDATWKYAREMDKANQQHHQYPKHMIRVSLQSTDMMKDDESSSTFRPRRFDIRTPPSENHLSTAEAISWVVSKLEGDMTIHETIMKPLDLMVSKWHSFIKPS